MMAGGWPRWGVMSIAVLLVLVMRCWDPAAADCATNATYDNWDAELRAAVPGPKLPDISSRPVRTYGAVGSCAQSASDGFDGGEIVVAATLPLSGDAATSSYAKIMRFTVELFCLTSKS